MAVKTGTVIVGGGQAGLSLSAYLTSRNHPHVVLERGRASVISLMSSDSGRSAATLSAISAPYDLFVTPTLTKLPRPFGYYDMSEPDIDRYNAKWADSVFAFPFNISGQPAISLPLGWSAGGVPIGVQLVGRYGDEATALAASAQLEREIPWQHRRPPL